ncbi:MAG: CNP1-like family protein [Burkholderiales bacterium]
MRLAMKGMRAVCVLLAALALGGCTSGEDRWLRVPDPDDEKRSEDGGPPKDVPVKLPPFPEESRLLPFEVGGASRNAFYVDAESISVGEDWAIRFTSVIVSPQGARTVSYEALDCTHYAYKLYATGHPDGTWAEVKQPQWRPIGFTEINRYRIVLFRDFFCPKKVPVRSSGEAIRALKSGAHSRADDSY